MRFFTEDEKRIYPHENLFAHVLGYVNIDGKGSAGIERLYDDKLTSDYTKNLQLSLDVRVQNILHSELKKAVSMHYAAGGAGLVVDANNGEILAMVSLPDFNPHHLKGVKSNQLFNKIALGAYEMGSTLKPFTVAIGLDTQTIKINDAFDVSRPLKVGRFFINDYKGKGGYLTVPEILMYSSNLGVSQIARTFGVKTQKEYLEKFGFLSPVNIGIPETAKPIFPKHSKWSDASLVTISYGHGLAITGVHLAQAMSSLVNGGMYYQPTFIKYDGVDDLFCKRVIKERTSLMMRKLLRLNVASGSAKKAEVNGFLVGGKTGTAEKNKNGRYNKKLNLSLFVGAFPMNDPQYVVLVMLDEAKKNEVNRGYITGGMVAAPIAGNIITRISQVLGLAQQNHDDKDILQAMYLDYTPMYAPRLAKR